MKKTRTLPPILKRLNNSVFNSAHAAFVICAAIAACCPAIVRADNDPDPYAEILSSKQLKNIVDKTNGPISGFKYPLGPWFTPGSNFERIFKQPHFAEQLFQWVTPASRDYYFSREITQYPKTHIHCQVEVRGRVDRKPYMLTILVPHPSFLMMTEGKVVEDFSQREPPDLKITDSAPLSVQGFKGTMYLLEKDQCSAVIMIAHSTMIDVHSMEKCGSLSKISALVGALNLTRLDQRLRS